MNINLERMHLPQTAVANPAVPSSAAEGAAGAAGSRPNDEVCVGMPALTVVENTGAAAIPGEEPVDERALVRDDPLGELVDQAFGAASEVAKNIGESADKLRELFERNKEDAEVKEQRLESVLKADAAKSSGDDGRLDALLREAELQA